MSSRRKSLTGTLRLSRSQLSAHFDPLRHEYVEHKEKPAEPDVTITNLRLENKPYLLSLHRTASLISDKVAYGLVKTLRVPTDLFFAKKYGHRAIVLETVGTIRCFLLYF